MRYKLLICSFILIAFTFITTVNAEESQSKEITNTSTEEKSTAQEEEKTDKQQIDQKDNSKSKEEINKEASEEEKANTNEENNQTEEKAKTNGENNQTIEKNTETKQNSNRDKNVNAQEEKDVNTEKEETTSKEQNVEEKKANTTISKPSTISKQSTSIQESKTSKLGHIRSSSVSIYTDLTLNSSTKAGSKYTDAVYYIKKQAKVNDQLYYLISKEPSSERGVVGWVKASNLSTHAHVGVDKKSKSFYIKGTGNAYAKAWGGSKDLVYDMDNYKDEAFQVHLTEKVGNNTWYRADLDGQTVWLHENYVYTDKVEESKTSKLGHIRSSSVKIYDDLKLNSSTKAGSKYTDAVYYIKKQAKVNNQLYYLISKEPSSSRGVVGWVKASDLSTHTHVGVDKKSKTFYIKGTGNAYGKAWGGSKDLVYDMDNYKDDKFQVHLTEKVGNNIWYRANLNGKTVWLHESYVYQNKIEESKTSKLGHIRDNDVRIYATLGNNNYTVAGTSYTNQVFYIKKEATLNDELYYLISEQPSSTKGTVGWVKATDLSTHSHVGVDKQAKTFYLNGKGEAFTKAWGGSKDLVYDLSKYRDEKFQVHLTEKVGNNIWYRGTLNGKTVWAHESFVFDSEVKESKTSKLGHIRNNDVRIYKNLKTRNYKLAGDTYTNQVYYMKKQATFGNETYYLISNEPSSVNGVVGWVQASDLSTHTHVGVDKDKKLFYISGNGSAYTKAWGGSKDTIYKNLSDYKRKMIKVNLTEKVGNNIWYRGDLDGNEVWVHESLVSEEPIKTTDYNYTLNEMLDIQMSVSPQTDKHRNDPIWVHSSDLVVSKNSARIKGKITGSNVNIRSKPDLSTNNNKEIQVNRGEPFEYLGIVKGSSFNGSTTWYKINIKGKNNVYVHSALATNSVSYYEKASSSSHRYGNLSFTSPVSILKKSGSWYELNVSRTWRNAKRADVKEKLDPAKQNNLQFLTLSESVNASATDLNKVLKGKGVLSGKASSFIKGGKDHGVNELYLISHALLESGEGKSELAEGIDVGKDNNGNLQLVNNNNRKNLTAIKTVYNMYGIGANDNCAISCGARKAYEKGWFTIEKAIEGGAEFVSNNYFSRGQNTLYKMRWNPDNPGTHQYATDIGWADKQMPRMQSMEDLYELVPNAQKIYDIPQYK